MTSLINSRSDPYYIPHGGNGIRKETVSPSQINTGNLSFQTMSFLAVANEMGSIKGQIDKMLVIGQIQRDLKEIQLQLAPNQEVRVAYGLTKDESFGVQQISQPGMGYLSDPEKTMIFELKGEDKGICYANPPENTEKFYLSRELEKLESKEFELFEDSRLQDRSSENDHDINTDENTDN